MARVRSAIENRFGFDDPEPAELAALDQFHLGGLHATRELARFAGVQPGDNLVDIGAGIGGPARILARDFGAKVTAVDKAKHYCDINKFLNEQTKCEIDVVQADATELPLDDDSFDVVWTQATSMAIEDKAAFFGELSRIARPGSIFASTDVIAIDSKTALYPTPWAETEKESFLQTSAEYEDSLESVGWYVESVTDLTQDALAFITKLRASDSQAAGLSLELIVEDFETKSENVARCLAESRIAVVHFLARAK